MQVVVYRTRNPKARRVADAFAAGCQGRIAESINRLERGPAAFYGVKPETHAVWQAAQKRGAGFFYIDNGYFGSVAAPHFYRVTRDAEQHTGNGPGDPARLHRAGIRIEPWKSDRGETVLIATQSPWWYRWHGTSIGAWLGDTLTQVRAATDRQIKVRVKPRFAFDPDDAMDIPEFMDAMHRAKVMGRDPSLADDIAEAWCVIAHSSAVAIDAILAGVPSFVTAPCAAQAMAAGDIRDIERPKMPSGRQEWAECLAANQWTLGELRDGTCWRALSENVSPE